MAQRSTISEVYSGGILNKIVGVFRKESGNASRELEYYRKIVKKQPKNTNAYLKMAELYNRKGEKQRAIDEYLRVAEIFSRNNLYPQAMAIYKRVLKQDPRLDHLILKIAEIYKKMGFLGDAFFQYNALLQNYSAQGMSDKIIEIMGLMTELNPGQLALEKNLKNIKEFSKFNEQMIEGKYFSDLHVSGVPAKGESFFDLGAELEMNKPVEFCGCKEVATDKVYGFREIFKELHEKDGPSAVYSNFNYQMGLACHEMGFIDESIEQLQIALLKGQSPFESASLLGFCYMDKGWWKEARQSFKTALRVEGAPAEKVLDIERALDVIRNEITREQEIHDPPNEIYAQALDFDSESEEKTLYKHGLMAHEGLSSLPGW
ncbi:MAG: hypothetical protein A2Z51_05530 [Deltaproteobacteria bacterium RBG_19FT_COMBO_52_11]|nr:MAG: hypothetical protein A2Z51_05530 [Deltaproteobacteria bacterium RBG_19FT_COMBO_52_11]